MEKPEKALEPVETANKLMIETAEEEKTEPMSEDSEIEPVVKKQRKGDDFTSIMIELEVMNKNQIKRSKIILDLINHSEKVTIESNDVLHVNKETLGIKASTFLYNLQQPTKKSDIEKYSKILIALNFSSHLVAKTQAKQILEASSESEQEFFPSREQPSQQAFSSTGERLIGSKPIRKKKFGHLLIDLDPKTSDVLRYCSNIVPPGPSIFYLPSAKAVITNLSDERERSLYAGAAARHIKLL